MDPLGVTAPIVDALSLPRWSSTPVPAYENGGSPASSGRTQNPFPIRRDLNSKVALWCVFYRCSSVFFSKIFHSR